MSVVTTDAYSTCHQEHLPSLPYFCWSIREAVCQSGVSPEQALKVFQASISAECVRCEMKLSGSELFELVENREPPSMVTKMGRLRLGYCAREGCQSYDYRVILRNHPPYDWPQMVATITQLRQKTPERRLSTESFRNLYFDLAHSRTFLRLAMAFAVGVMVTLAWQWHRGGRIPILREPEEFQVAPMPAPAGAEDNSVD